MLADSGAMVHLVKEYKGLRIYRFLDEGVKLSHTEDDMSLHNAETVAKNTFGVSHPSTTVHEGVKSMQLQ